MTKLAKYSTWGFARYVDLIWYGYLIVGVMFTCLVAFALFSDMGTSIFSFLYTNLDLPVTAILSADDITALIGSNPDTQRIGLAIADLRFVNPLDPRTRLITTVGLPTYYLFVLALLFVGRKLLQSFERGDPFSAQSSRWIRQIAVLMLALAIARTLLLHWNTWLYRDELASAGLRVVNPTVRDPWLVLAAIICWVLAYVFETGRRLREDEQLTI